MPCGSGQFFRVYITNFKHIKDRSTGKEAVERRQKHCLVAATEGCTTAAADPGATHQKHRGRCVVLCANAPDVAHRSGPLGHAMADGTAYAAQVTTKSAAGRAAVLQGPGETATKNPPRGGAAGPAADAVPTPVLSKSSHSKSGPRLLSCAVSQHRCQQFRSDSMHAGNSPRG